MSSLAELQCELVGANIEKEYVLPDGDRQAGQARRPATLHAAACATQPIRRKPIRRKQGLRLTRGARTLPSVRTLAAPLTTLDAPDTAPLTSAAPGTSGPARGLPTLTVRRMRGSSAPGRGGAAGAFGLSRTELPGKISEVWNITSGQGRRDQGAPLLRGRRRTGRVRRRGAQAHHQARARCRRACSLSPGFLTPCSRTRQYSRTRSRRAAAWSDCRRLPAAGRGSRWPARQG